MWHENITERENILTFLMLINFFTAHHSGFWDVLERSAPRLCVIRINLVSVLAAEDQPVLWLRRSRAWDTVMVGQPSLREPAGRARGLSKLVLYPLHLVPYSPTGCL